jgi:hypothetical protein
MEIYEKDPVVELVAAVLARMSTEQKQALVEKGSVPELVVAVLSHPDLPEEVREAISRALADLKTSSSLSDQEVIQILVNPSKRVAVN